MVNRINDPVRVPALSCCFDEGRRKTDDISVMFEFDLDLVQTAQQSGSATVHKCIYLMCGYNSGMIKP